MTRDNFLTLAAVLIALIFTLAVWAALSYFDAPGHGFGGFQ